MNPNGRRPTSRLHPRNPRPTASFGPGDWIAGTPYRVVRALGVGGMGEVYEVDHTKTGTRRAIKVVRASLRGDPLLAQRLVREGRMLRSVEHPNVLRVFEVGALPDGRPYFAMELIEGQSLRRLQAKQAPLPWRRALVLIIQALDGLAAIHAQGMVHRDVKPSNLLLDARGRIKVLDLGIAKSTDPNASGPRTRDGVILGTTRYMAPEQLLGRPMDARGDVYAAALVLFELITGAHPADAMSACGGSLLPRMDKPPPRISPWVPVKLPEGFDAVMQRALAIEPADRFPSAAAFALALRAFVAVPALSARRGAAPVARLRYEPRLPCTQTDETTTIPRTFFPFAKRRGRSHWAVLHAASVVLSLLAMVAAVGMTWIAAKNLRGSHARCTGAAIEPLDASAIEHVGERVRDR